MALQPTKTTTDIKARIGKEKAALMVIVLSPRTRAWLAENDPKALQQCREALDLDNLIARSCNYPSLSEADDFATLFTNEVPK